MTYENMSTFQVIVAWTVSVFAGITRTLLAATFLGVSDPIFRKLFRVE